MEVTLEVFQVGDRGLTLSINEKISLKNQQKIWWISKKIRESYDLKDMIVDIVPGMNNLTLLLNPYIRKEKTEVEKVLKDLWETVSSLDLDNEIQGKLIEVPVSYGGEKGPDLLEVAKIHNMTPEMIIEKHTAPIYTVYFVGFMPGFVYLGGLDPLIHTERRSTPRLNIPAGSVGIGGAQTGVYPSESPGGWQIIGNTDAILFEKEREQPSLFLPGDQLHFTVKEVLL